MTEHIAQRLRDIAAELPTERVTVATLALAHGHSAHGALLLLLAVPCVLPIPGTGTVLGLGLLALATAIWRGELAATLPRRVAEMEMSREAAQRVLTTMARIYTLGGRLTRQRLHGLAGGGGRAVLSVVVALMAGVLILPIPFGNVLPALSLVLIGLGPIFRDGLAVLLGHATACITVLGLTLLSLAAAGWGGAWLTRLWA